MTKSTANPRAQGSAERAATEMLRTVGVHEAKTRFSELLRIVATGEEIQILRGGTPVARLVPERPIGRRQFFLDEGAFVVPDDFDAPMTEEELAEFGA